LGSSVASGKELLTNYSFYGEEVDLPEVPIGFSRLGSIDCTLISGFLDLKPEEVPYMQSPEILLRFFTFIAFSLQQRKCNTSRYLFLKITPVFIHLS
jgi:hypothetical protein